MTQIKIKRVYDDPEKSDGYRVLVDRLWPRGMKKECLKYDEWAKEITPSPELRKWFHQNMTGHWQQFETQYKQELSRSETMKAFLKKIKPYQTVTLLYASREPLHNHARILQQYIEDSIRKQG